MPPLDSGRNDTNTRTVQLVQLISEIGPDIPEISRRLGQFKESVRYRYKEKLLEKGLTVQAVVDHEKLGLKRVLYIIEFPREYREYAESILTVMGEIGYVVAFRMTFPTGSYVVEASVPEEYVAEYARLLRSLEERGMFTVTGLYEFDWFRNRPMLAQFYDFDTGRWDFDWSTEAKPDLEAANFLPSGKTNFDYLDLLLLKELQADATRSLVDIAKKLGVNYKVAAWHLSAHVLPRKLVRGYLLTWPGTRYDFKIEKALHRKHRYFWAEVLVKNITEKERMGLMSVFNRVPFLWAEAGGKNYFAQFAFPVDYYTEALQFVRMALSDFGSRAELHLPDQTRALAFSIGYKLYDQGAKRWSFNSADMLEGFDRMILRIKEGGGKPG